MNELKRKLTRLHSDYVYATKTVKDERTNLKTAKQRQQDVQIALELVQSVAAVIQQQAHKGIAGVVTRCLKAVFGEDSYEFKLDFRKKRNKTEAVPLFVRGEMELEPQDAAGGGVIDVAAFSLRVACLILAFPKRRRLLVLDEPFRHLSKGYRPAAKELIETLAEEMGIQFIIVTHDPELTCGKVIEL